MIGAYGPWAASIAGDGPARLSFRNPKFAVADLDAWRRQARERFRAGVLMLETGGVPRAELQHQFEHDGLTIEHRRWSLPYGPPIEAYFPEAAGARGRLPSVLAFHDHDGNKYFGARKIARISADVHPMMRRHQDQYYGGLAWADELARRGYGVLVHDAFSFASRGVRVADLPEVLHRKFRLGKEVRPESEAEIDAYNAFAAQHEHILAKSFLSTRPLPRLVPPRPAQVRPADAGRGVRLVRSLAQGMMRPL